MEGVYSSGELKYAFVEDDDAYYQIGENVYKNGNVILSEVSVFRKIGDYFFFIKGNDFYKYRPSKTPERYSVLISVPNWLNDEKIDNFFTNNENSDQLFFTTSSDKNFYHFDLKKKEKQLIFVKITEFISCRLPPLGNDILLESSAIYKSGIMGFAGTPEASVWCPIFPEFLQIGNYLFLTSTKFTYIFDTRDPLKNIKFAVPLEKNKFYIVNDVVVYKYKSNLFTIVNENNLPIFSKINSDSVFPFENIKRAKKEKISVETFNFLAQYTPIVGITNNYILCDLDNFDFYANNTQKEYYDYCNNQIIKYVNLFKNDSFKYLKTIPVTSDKVRIFGDEKNSYENNFSHKKILFYILTYEEGNGSKILIYESFDTSLTYREINVSFVFDWDKNIYFYSNTLKRYLFLIDSKKHFDYDKNLQKISMRSGNVPLFFHNGELKYANENIDLYLSINDIYVWYSAGLLTDEPLILIEDVANNVKKEIFNIIGSYCYLYKNGDLISIFDINKKKIISRFSVEPNVNLFLWSINDEIVYFSYSSSSIKKFIFGEGVVLSSRVSSGMCIRNTNFMEIALNESYDRKLLLIKTDLMKDFNREFSEKSSYTNIILSNSAQELLMNDGWMNHSISESRNKTFYFSIPQQKNEKIKDKELLPILKTKIKNGKVLEILKTFKRNFKKEYYQTISVLSSLVISDESVTLNEAVGCLLSVYYISVLINSDRDSVNGWKGIVQIDEKLYNILNLYFSSLPSSTSKILIKESDLQKFPFINFNVFDYFAD